MSEFSAREQRISVGLDLAHEANIAHDRGDSANFYRFSEAAAELVGLAAEGSEDVFRLVEQADVEVLPAAYRETVIDRHNEMVETVAEAIKEGKLPNTYRLPGLRFFSERLKAVLPGFKAMEEQDWQPELVFVPKRLGLDQWHDILSGYDCSSEDEISVGIDRAWPVSRLVTSHKSYSLWDVAVISATDKPVGGAVSGDGTQGPDATRVWQTLSALPNMNAQGVQAATTGASPSIDTYLSLQWLRLARGEEPVDKDGNTLMKEKLAYADNELAVRGTWSLKYGRVEFDALPLYIRDEWQHHGVRPSIQGNEMLYS